VPSFLLLLDVRFTGFDPKQPKPALLGALASPFVPDEINFQPCAISLSAKSAILLIADG